ncbi:hypothetical protein EYF80_051699 [Liparis tanakae]|uniref:Uncharacterized protein n=1 Tax=Liparis tanakae TaxID=230148 RepID=A0A4Z2FAG5_9TELE|nr:hypothetical protein EYF80_051699 [Liparis tanakae]
MAPRKRLHAEGFLQSRLLAVEKVGLHENGEEPLSMLLYHWRNEVSITALWAVWIRAVTAAS